MPSYALFRPGVGCGGYRGRSGGEACQDELTLACGRQLKPVCSGRGKVGAGAYLFIGPCLILTGSSSQQEPGLTTLLEEEVMCEVWAEGVGIIVEGGQIWCEQYMYSARVS